MASCFIYGKTENTMHCVCGECAEDYRQVKKLLNDEGFADLPTMIKRYKLVMLAANEIAIEQDEKIELLKYELAEREKEIQILRDDLGGIDLKARHLQAGRNDENISSL